MFLVLQLQNNKWALRKNCLLCTKLPKMKYFHYIFFILILSCSLFVNCAKRGHITGGPKDTLPPILLKATPELYTTNFSSKEIKLTFDEYIKLNKLNQQLIISPPMEYAPDITPMGFANKQITIKILDTLKPNTTYSINFGQSIVDNNEGNAHPNFRYVFSTGNYIDSLTVTARLKDAISKKNNSFTKVVLYDATDFSDSTIYKKKPMYVANSLDSLNVVTIENIKEGRYRLLALHEKNNNYLFDPATDKIAFIDELVVTPKDTIYQLTLFKEAQQANFGRPTMVSQNKWLLAAEGNLKNIKIEVSDFSKNLQTAFFKVDKKDSLHVFVPPTNADSLKFTMRNGNLVKEQIVKTRTVRTKDSLTVRFITSSVLNITDSLRISGNTPFTHIDRNNIRLMKKDSTEIPYQIVFDTLNNQIKIAFDKEENTEYVATLYPRALQDVFGKSHDTLSTRFKTPPYSEYANLTIKAVHAYKTPVKIELLDVDETVHYSQWIPEDQLVRFSHINPNKYFIRVWIDENANGQWDTGSYLEKRQPEKVIHFPNVIDARANWEINETITIQ